MANDSTGLPREPGEGGSPRRFQRGSNVTDTDKGPNEVLG